MSQASEDTVYVCCECVPEPDLGVALHMIPCEKHGRGWHRIVKREVRSVQEPSLLEAQQLLFPAEIALSQTRRDRLLAVVQLYKALGGGWKLTDSQWAQGHP